MPQPSRDTTELRVPAPPATCPSAPAPLLPATGAANGSLGSDRAESLYPGSPRVALGLMFVQRQQLKVVAQQTPGPVSTSSSCTLLAQHPPPKAASQEEPWLLCPSPREASLTSQSSHPCHCPKGCLQHSGQPNLEGHRGPGQLFHFPPTKSQKWQKVKAH